LAAKETSTPRCAAIVGPYLSGKTTLLESMLNACGALSRKGSVGVGNTVGDSSPESRNRGMSVEINIASAQYLGEDWTFIDCPGSIELAQEALNAIAIADIAVLVVEPGAQKAIAATHIHQQNGWRRGPGQSHAGGLASAYRTAAGTARNPDPRR
jgi:elongation factor G